MNSPYQPRLVASAIEAELLGPEQVATAVGPTRSDPRALREAGRGRECRRDPRGRPSKFEGGRGRVRPRRAERSARQIVRETPTKKKKNCIVALAHHKARTAYPMNLAALRFQLGRMSPLMILI